VHAKGTDTAEAWKTIYQMALSFILTPALNCGYFQFEKLGLFVHWMKLIQSIKLEMLQFFETFQPFSCKSTSTVQLNKE
jgi:hypothetical protein